MRQSTAPRSGPERVAAIASVPPSRHKASGPLPESTPPRPDASTDEPDSLIEHARIVPPGQTINLGGHDHDDSEADEADPTLKRGGADDTVARLSSWPVAAPAPGSETSLEVPSPSGRLPVDADRFTSVPPPSSAPGSQIARRLGELAREALLAADNVAFEGWVDDGLSAVGESSVASERARVMERLARGDVGDILRALRRTRAQLDPRDHRRRCQTSLALGVALSVAGRPDEALLEGMDALARARQTGDERGAKACLAFLAKLYTSASRERDAERLRAMSVL
jgi:hypothetical protein